MGWCCEDGTHEGYLVGLVPDEAHGVFVGHIQGRWRELSGRDEITTSVEFVQVACSCGWRSPLLRAPDGTQFMPSSVMAPKAFEDDCAQLWDLHVAASGPARDGGCSIRTLLHHAREHEERVFRRAAGPRAKDLG